MFINPDLTLYVERPPIGEWIGLESRTMIAPGGIATAESVLYDERGRVGRRPRRSRSPLAERHLTAAGPLGGRRRPGRLADHPVSPPRACFLRAAASGLRLALCTVAALPQV